MLIATFNSTTGWAGKTIAYEDGVFMLEGHGSIGAADVLAYDGLDQVSWAYDGLHEWVATLAGVTVTPPSVATAEPAIAAATVASEDPPPSVKTPEASQRRLYPGMGCTVELDHHDIVLAHEETECPWTIPLDAVSDVHCQPAKQSNLGFGYVRLVLNGADVPQVEPTEALRDPATVIFHSSAGSRFAELVAILRTRIMAAKTRGVDPADVTVPPAPILPERFLPGWKGFQEVIRSGLAEAEAHRTVEETRYTCAACGNVWYYDMHDQMKNSGAAMQNAGKTLACCGGCLPALLIRDKEVIDPHKCPKCGSRATKEEKVVHEVG